MCERAEAVNYCRANKTATGHLRRGAVAASPNRSPPPTPAQPTAAPPASVLFRTPPTATLTLAHQRPRPPATTDYRPFPQQPTTTARHRPLPTATAHHRPPPTATDRMH